MSRTSETLWRGQGGKSIFLDWYVPMGTRSPAGAKVVNRESSPFTHEAGSPEGEQPRPDALGHTSQTTRCAASKCARYGNQLIPISPRRGIGVSDQENKPLQLQTSAPRGLGRNIGVHRILPFEKRDYASLFERDRLEPLQISL